MPHFFVPPENISADRIAITGQDAFHLKNVLRVKKGESLGVSDGENHIYQVRVVELSHGSVVTQILEKKSLECEPQTTITLVQSLAKHPKMEWIVQKGTEIGVSRFWPVLTERSIPHLNSAKQDKQSKRWQKISEAAAKQCGRLKIPQVSTVRSWPEALGSLKSMDLVILPWEGETKQGIKTVLAKRKTPRSLAVLIGPEGGFSQREAGEAQKAGALPVTLGPRILRTETAGLIACALILHELGQ